MEENTNLEPLISDEDVVLTAGGKNGKERQITINRRQVYELARLMTKNSEMADFYGISANALTTNFGQEIKAGKAAMKLTFRRKIFEDALGPKAPPALMIFFAKNLLNMSDNGMYEEEESATFGMTIEQQIQSMALWGSTIEEISIITALSEAELQTKYQHLILKGRAEGQTQLRKKQYQDALDGEGLIHQGKHRLAQVDELVLTSPTTNGLAPDTKRINQLSREELIKELEVQLKQLKGEMNEQRH